MTALRPVSFRKPRERAPRLSPSRVEGRRHSRFWSDDEKDIVRKYYPMGGVGACQPHLPNRSERSIYQAARKLGIRLDERAKPERHYVVASDLDEQIREAWPLLKGRGAVSELAKTLSVPRRIVSQRALKLGLTMPHTKEPPWTDAEFALMHKVPLHDPKRASAIFRQHGFKRTPSAIVSRAKRMNLSRRYKKTLSAVGAARILGVDTKWVTSRCIAGDLKAGRRGTERLPQQGGDAWTIERADLRQFVIDNLERIDIRKVDKFAFVDLMVGGLDGTR